MRAPHVHTPDAPAASDAALLARAGAGDRGAFAQFMQRHQDAVFRVARRLTRSAADAEDVFQHAFLAVWRACAAPDSTARFRGTRDGASARAWLFTIVRHAAAKTHRRRTRHPDEAANRVPLDDSPAQADLVTLGAAAGWGAPETPEQLASTLQSRTAVQDAIAGLPAPDRAVIVLCDVGGLSAREACAVLNLGESALRSRLHRARLKLRAALREVPHG